jgi:hypothetical protein
VVADAKKYIGVPYVLDGESMSGMDCSGLVQQVYKDEGVALPRQVHTQKLEGTAVPSLAEAQPGDLIVFKGGGHIAIYAGNDTVIHAPYPGRTVSEQKLWVGDSGIDTIRRIVPATSTAPKAAAPAPVTQAPAAAAPVPIAPAPVAQAPVSSKQAIPTAHANGPAAGAAAATSSSAPMTAAQAQLSLFSGGSGVTGSGASFSASSLDAFLSSMPNGLSTDSVADFLGSEKFSMEASLL